MPTGPARPRPRRRLWRALLALAGVVVVAAAVLGYGLWRGWFDSGSVTGTARGFVPSQAPKGSATAGAWPEYGFDAERTRANPALDLAPPYRTLWRRDAGSLLEFPPVIGGGRVVVGTNGGFAMALDADTGRVIWRRRLRGRVASSPALAGPLALVTTTRGLLYALDAGTGGVRWRWDAGSSIESSPLVVSGSAYVGTLDGRVVRLSLATHRPVWTARAAGDVKASLALAGPAVVVGDYSGKVSAFARRDGRLLWRTTSPGERLRGSGRFYAGPAVAYGRVFLGNVNGRVLGLQAGSGDLAWVRVVSDYVYSSAAVADRTVFVGSYDHKLYALDAVTGRPRWTQDLGERISGSPTVLGNLVFASTLARRPSDGRTVAIDVRTGRRVWTFPDGRYSPAVGVHGLLVLTGVRTLYGLRPR